MTCHRFTLICWSILWIYWIVASNGNKKDVYRHNSFVRAITWAGPVLGYVLLFAPLSIGWLGTRLFHQDSAIQIVGACVCPVGAAFAIWARHTIGTNWSGTMTLKEGHELIQAGPYGLVRHPIYAGLLLAFLGAAMALGEVRGFMAVLMAAVAFMKKMNDEECIMNMQFPDEYPKYQARVRRLVPFIF